MSWKLFKFERRPARRLPFRRNALLRLEELEARVVPSTDVTAYHQASPVPSPSSTIGAGVNSNETILTPANVNATDFGKLFATTVDGQVYAEPLYMENVNITTGAHQGTHNVVFVATQHDSLYAIDANTGTILWQDALLTPEHGGTVTSVPNSAVNSGDISPEIGITATPVIDPGTNTIFVENKTQEVASDGTHFEHHLYAINIGSGAITKEVLIADSIGDTVVSGPSVEGNGAGSSGGVVKFDALRQLDRPALTLVNGNIYLAYASHGDNPPYHGWILGYSESTLALTAVFNANPNGSDGGIWQSGGTLAYETVNGNTYLYFETGNGTFETTLTPSPFNSSLMIPNQGDYGDSFVKVEIDGSTPASGSLNATNNTNGWGMHVVDYFTPIDEGNLNADDGDLGSGAPLLLPASAGSASHPNLMVGSGKEGRIYLIDRDNMGGYHGDAAGDGNSGTDNVVQETAAGAINGSFDTPTFYNGVLYYVGGYGDEARTFTVANAVMSNTSVTQSTDSYPFPGSTATISTNPSGGNAIVWDIAGPGTNQLRAYNASQGYSSEIYTSAQAANSRDALGSAVKFTVPTVADGEVFVGTTNSVVAYGLLQQAPTATFLKTDTTTEGSWQGVYGSQGYNVIDNASSYPSYAQVSASGNSNYVWSSSTTDPRALQDASGSGRIAATWFSNSSFTVNVNLTDGQTHQLALYLLDWDKNGRSEQVQILNATTGQVLTTETASGFGNGEYLVWNVSGDIEIKITNLNSSTNAVLNGLFFDPAGTPPPPPSPGTASFVKTDTTTEGSWKGVYGSQGYNVIDNASSYPSYAQVSASGNSNYVWSTSTTDPRALQDATGSGRIAATWFSKSSFTINVDMTDGQTHQLALYLLDYENQGRQEEIDILDASTGNVLSTETASNFSNGEYLVWDVSGDITIRVQFLGSSKPANAVLSGIFFG